MAESSGKRRASVGVLFWIAFILLVLVIFLANRSNIEQVLQNTGIVDVIRDRVASDNTEETVAEDPEASPGETDPVAGDPVATPDPESVTEPSPAEPAIVFETDSEAQGDATGTTDTQPAEDVAEPAQASDEPEVEESGATDVPGEPERDVTRPNRRMAALYFIQVTDDGRTHAQRVVRAVDYDQSPLTETIRTLIAGPTGDELDAGLLNLIPSETQLISAHVSDGVAYLNFNESFRFNPMGAEGTVAQLQQIIYSSTEFPTVTRVQFLIEGERLDYVGGDGIYIGQPLGRDAFSS